MIKKEGSRRGNYDLVNYNDTSILVIYRNRDFRLEKKKAYVVLGGQRGETRDD